ncbi:type IV secretion system protein VirD4 [Burkholderia stagnalis]|uniref:Type IV secretion system protein VirD4 n=1 Tax=Burkholderia stagnalis TaxID=1503054 RepID=A0ABX9YQ36_9BURK|nr:MULTISPECIES: type IV secretion system DNA-binding domain-containing protein [Burkholderia]MDD1493979.1 type IV secretion system DNA-binding domain-containing protein [Burkholderia thailandensis]RQY93750.1 type IV secretion system protein VirD4 [Burkholderia stagnalis]RQZ19472.1 type IV secretion system protein VirD4 [Burkholderia stagnalis]
MTERVISDAGAGRALLLTRVKLTMHAASMAFWVGALPAMVAPCIWWMSSLSDHDIDLVKANIVSHLVNQDVPRRWRVRDGAGEPRILTVVKSDGELVQWMTAPQFRAVTPNLARPVTAFRYVAWVSVGLGLAGYLSIWYSLKRLGRRARENKRIDGAQEIVEPVDLTKQVKREEPGPYRILDVALPRSAPMQGIMFMGAQGTGKSLGIHDLMQQVFARGKKSVIYDHSGEYYRAYFRPGKDLFFNPAMLGSVAWSIFRELANTYDADTLSHAFLPPKGGVVHGASAFFEDAARALFSVMVLRLRQRGAEYTRLISEAILAMPEDELELLIEKSVASSAVGGDSKGQRQGVISSIAIYLNGISAVQDGTWTMRKFFEVDDDTRLFLVGTDDTNAMFAPLFRLLLTIGFKTIAARREICHEDRYWFFLDEVHVLGDIKLDEHQATLRKFGVCVVGGIQADKQFNISMGPDRAETVMNCFNTAVMLRANEPNMMDRMARRLGRKEMAVVNSGQAIAVTDWRDGGQLNQGEQEKWVVMPSKLGELKNCTAYLKLPSYPPALVDYRHWVPRWYRPWARANRFRKRQEDPPRDPRFKIAVAEGQDAIESVRREAEALRAEAEAKEAEKGAGKPAGKWIVTDLDTGEVMLAEAVAVTSTGGDGGHAEPNDEEEGLF